MKIITEIKDEMGKQRISCTIAKTYANGSKIVLSQSLHPKFKTGHYFFYIQDIHCRILYAGSSTAAPKEKVTMRGLGRIYKKYKD